MKVRVRTATFAYDILKNTSECILISDRCEEHNCMSITNAAEVVIDDLEKRHLLDDDKRVFYEDTMGQVDELLFDNVSRRFAGFAPGPHSI